MSETKERKTDRRVEKTKQAMRHAFVELLKRKPYNAITISELTREADIDRRTFYLHYESIEDLVKEMQKIARDAITEQLKQRGNVQLDTLFDCLSAVAQDKIDFYRVIFTEPSCSGFFQEQRSNTAFWSPTVTLHFPRYRKITTQNISPMASWACMPTGSGRKVLHCH